MEQAWDLTRYIVDAPSSIAYFFKEKKDWGPYECLNPSGKEPAKNEIEETVEWTNLKE